MAGIIGVYSKDNAAVYAHDVLFQTQHRGQENAGISGLGNHSLRIYKGKRLISKVFHEELFKSFVHPTDYVAVGHVGNEKVERKDIPPVLTDNENYELSIAINGFIMNHKEVDKEHGMKTFTDEELFGKLFLEKTDEYSDITDSLSSVMEELDKAYFSFVMGVRDKKAQRSQLIGGRDKRGIRPMYMGRTNNSLYISSESGSIDMLENFGKEFVEKRDVIPGEIIGFDQDFYNRQALPPERKHCIFEWVYTARPDAVIEGKNSHMVRKKLGHLLSELHDIKKDNNSVIVPIPDSGRSVSLGVHEATGIPFDEGLIKNQYIGRTYIIPDSNERRQAATLKHNPIRKVVNGKRVLFGDDSIVRGTISEAVSETLLNAGAKEVELLISYAPIFEPCHSDEFNKKLTARGMEDKDVFEIGERVAKKLPSVNKVYYNTVENVIKAVGLPREHLCTKCITGEDPFA